MQTFKIQPVLVKFDNFLEFRNEFNLSNRDLIFTNKRLYKSFIEDTNISIAEFEKKGTKLGLVSPALFPDYAVLIPELVKDLPYGFFLSSSVDALIHAVEAYLSPKSSKYSEVFSVEAIKLIIEGYKLILKNGEEYRKEIIDDFLVASNYAGIAFSNAGVGAVHALSYPLGGKYHVPHGESNYALFMEVIKFYNKKKADGKIKSLGSILAGVLSAYEKEDVFEKLTELLNALIPVKKLSTYGMTADDVVKFSDTVFNTQQRLLSNNYVEMTIKDIENIYGVLL